MPNSSIPRQEDQKTTLLLNMATVLIKLILQIL
jgi:hypothetical protein